MDETDPELVWLLYNTSHLVCLGEEYIAIFKKYLPQIRHIHLKDVCMKVRDHVKEIYNDSLLQDVRELDKQLKSYYVCNTSRTWSDSQNYDLDD